MPEKGRHLEQSGEQMQKNCWAFLKFRTQHGERKKLHTEVLERETRIESESKDPKGRLFWIPRPDGRMKS
jgi:hypothetical protein